MANAAKLAADAQQVEISRLVEQAANDKFETADKAFKAEQEETRARMVASGDCMARFEEAVQLVAEGGLDQFVKQLEDQRRATEGIINAVRRTLTASGMESVSDLNDQTNQQMPELQNRIQVKLSDVEEKIQCMFAGGGG